MSAERHAQPAPSAPLAAVAAEGPTPGSEPESRGESGGESRGDPGPDSSSDSSRLGAESVGRYLARQRELRGISLHELSTLTRIPLRSLERLESGRFDGEADGFVRGFVRTVADALDLDPDDTVARMLAEVQIQDERVGRGPWAARLVAAALLLVVLGLGLAGVRALVSGESGAAGVESDRIVRRDPVRALAELTTAAGPPPPAETRTGGRSEGASEDAPPPAAPAEVALP